MKYIKEFFRNDHPYIPFKEFGYIHLFCIFFVIINLILIYHNREKISKLKETTKRKILLTLATIMLINMIIYNISPHIFNYFDYKIHLPFQLCFIAGYLFMIGIFFKKENLLKITFFLSFIGPIPAILWPTLPSTFDDFNFWKYFISHHIFICASFFSYYALNYKITKKDLLKTLVITNILVIVMMPFNHIFNMNYIYSSEIHQSVTNMFPFIKKAPAFIVIELTGIVITLCLSLLIKKRNNELRKESKNKEVNL